MPRYRDLTILEENIICKAGTEAPFTGKYYDTEKVGVYICKRCDLPLFLSSDKFHSGCGWPSFDEEIEKSVKKIPDKDGMRTEIRCAFCDGHLGHVFLNEGFTPKNTRFCVNSLSLEFIQAFTDSGYEKAYLAGGCFWGVEYFMQKIEGVLHVSSGFMGGHFVNPTYEEVCSIDTGHLETVEVIFDPKKITYEEILKNFFEIHDPTQENGQGPDVGSQYLSAIFYLSKKQKTIAIKVIDILKQKYKIQTKLLPASMFYKADAYHQNYYERTKKTPYCHTKTKRF